MSKKEKWLELLEEGLKDTFDFHLGEIQLKMSHAMYENYKNHGYITSIQSAMFASILTKFQDIIFDQIKSIADTLNGRLEIDDYEEIDLANEFMNEKGPEIFKAIDGIVRLRKEQDIPFTEELEKLLEEGKI